MNFKYGSAGSEVSRGTITTDGIDLKINSVADLILLPSGTNKVGVGTTNPSYKFHVSGASIVQALTSSAADVSMVFINTTSTNYIEFFNGEYNLYQAGGSASNVTLKITNAGAVRFPKYSGTLQTGTPTYILGTDASGNVVKVLGSSVPGSVSGSGTLNKIPLWTPNSSTIGDSMISQVTTSNVLMKGAGNNFILNLDPDNNAIGDTSTVIFNDRARVGWFNSAVYLGDGGSNKDIKLQTNLGDIISLTSNTERMRIKFDTGKVGIGTTTPVEQLTVFGQVASTSSSSTVNTAGANRAIMDLTGGGARMGHFRGATAAGSGFLRLFTDSVERMRISSAGDVGIGTTPTTGYKLDVVRTSPGYSIVGRHATGGKVGIYNSTGDNGIGTVNNYAFNLFTNNSAPQMSITTSGNVGIGATDADSFGRFLVSGTGNLINANATSGAATFQLYEGGQGRFGIVTLNGSAGAKFTIAGTEKMRITSVGNVGIGTNNPTEKLVVQDGKVLAGHTNTRGYGFHDLSNYTYTANTSRLSLVTAGTEAMSITSSQRVGIGITNPLGKLHVYNTATTSNGNGTASETAIGQDSITLYGHGGTNGQTYGSITWMGGSRRRAMISAVAENADTDYIGLAFYTQGTDGSGNYSESMRISRSGKVGIGTTSPTAKLHVAGTGLFTGLVSGITPVNSSNFVTKAYVDGSGGGTGPFLPLAGGTMSGDLKLNDNVDLYLGTGDDLQIFHSGTAGVINNKTGGLFIKSTQTDGNIVFEADNGSGGVATYFFLDGGSADGTNLYTKFPDSSRLLFGTGEDLQIYHDGSNSRINETGTGDLIITGGNDILFNDPNGFVYMNMNQSNSVELYYANSKKFETTNTGVAVTGNLTTTDDITISNTSPEIYLTNTNAAKYNWMVAAQENVDQSFEITPSTAAGGSTYSTPALQINGSTSNAIFAGKITSGNDIVNATAGVYTWTGDTDTFIQRSAANEIAFKTGAQTALVLDSVQKATFTGDVVINNSLSFSTNGFADFGNIGTGAMRFKPSGNTLALTLTGANATIAGKATSTQTAASDSSITLTTKSYVDGLVTGVPVYRGTWDARNNTERGSGSDGGDPDLRLAANKILGNYYIVETAGSATPNGANTKPDSWNVGDWCIFSDVTSGAGTDLWQKIDNTSVISGVGTGQKVTKWEGAGPSETLTDGPITFSGNNSTFAGTGTFEGNLTINGPQTIFNPDGNSQAKILNVGTNAIALYASSGDSLYLGGGGTTNLTLDASTGATFSGTVATIGLDVQRTSGSSSDILRITSADVATTIQRIENTSDAANGFGRIEFKTNAATGQVSGRGGFKFIDGDGNDILYLDNDNAAATFAGNATFAGQVLCNTNTTSPTSGDAAFYKSSAGAVLSGFQAILETGSAGSRATALTINNSQNATFAGNVTIGDNSASEIFLAFNSSATDFALGANGSNFMIGTSSDLDSGNLITLSGTNGNFGIGTTGPTSKLQVNYSAAPSFNANNGANALRLVRDDSGGDLNQLGAGLVFAQRYLNTDAALIGVGGIYGVKTIGSGSFGGGLAFYTQPFGSGNMNESMLINHAGNVKLGQYSGTAQTGTPTYLLGTDASGNVVKTLTTPSPVTSQAASLYDLIPNGAFTTTYAFTSTAGTYSEVMEGNDVITASGTYTVQMFVNDHAVGGTQYSETYSGIMSWASATNTNSGSGDGTISEIVLHRSGHATNTGMTYLRTRETTSVNGGKLKLEIMGNLSYTGASNVVFKFVRLI